MRAEPSVSRDFKNRLRRRARRAGVDLSRDLATSLEHYYSLLAKWNAKINLTSFRLEEGATDEAVDRLLVEPIVAARHLPNDAASVIDIGSGGGSPAIPLALAAPRVHVRMVESKTRKAVFLREVLRELGLGRAEVETSRYEELLLRPELHESLDVATIRAVRVEPRSLLTLQAFLKPGGLVLLFRGAAGDVTEAVRPPLAWVATHPLTDPARSKLVILQKNTH
jgi:16S rRNA (guanine527-N7)-methyltransferase